MNKICLCCGKELRDESSYWHPLCIKKMFHTSVLPKFEIDEERIIEENIGLGNAISGVQKKFSLDIDLKRKRKTFSIINQEYIIKTQQENLNNIVYYEWVAMKLASICKIDTVENGIIKNNDQLLYITKRIDRIGTKKIPMEDFCQLSNTQTEYKYHGSYEMCFKNVIDKYSDYKTLDKTKFYKIVLFSYIIGNTDMHLKNFSLYEIDGSYQLTPSYDLVPVTMVFNQPEMALSINGKIKNITRKDFFEFGKKMLIDEKLLNIIHKDFQIYKDKMINFINRTDLNEKEKNKFINLISQNIDYLCK